MQTEVSLQLSTLRFYWAESQPLINGLWRWGALLISRLYRLHSAVSPLYQSKTVQIRSHDFEIRVVPVPLDPAFPIKGGAPYIQLDKPITFLHIHGCLELGYCFSGSGVFIVGEKILPYQAGDVSFINQTEVHLSRSAPGTHGEWTWIYLDPVLLVNFQGEDVSKLDPTPLAGPGFNNIMSGKSHPAINRNLLRMVDELRGRSPGWKSSLRALTLELMILMHRLAPPTQKRIEPRDYERLAPALQTISSNFATPLKVGDLARCCNLSEPHFRRLFTRTIGRSPCAYLNDVRIRMAASLLRSTGRSVLEISLDVGFETLSSFNRLFNRCFGKSPRSWRAGTDDTEAF